ncbi:MAG: acetylornithine deacetylase [Solirubrobacteraceae bacterium]|nr:acetylornithine deacetylase [Solirubrobacteraceae bacterium]
MLLHPTSARTYAEVRRGAVIAIAAGAVSCQGALANLAGTVVARDHGPARAPDRFTGVLACLRRLRHAATAAELHVEAVVLAVPAWLDPDCGRAVSVVDADSEGLDLRTVLAEHAVERVQIETDVRLSALAQAWRGDAPAGGTFATLSLDAQVGWTIVTDGRPLRDRHYAAGDLGAALELDVAETYAMLARGDALAGPPLAELLDQLASAIRVLVGVADPAVVILDGSVGRALESHLEALRARLAGHLIAVPELRVSRLGEDAPVLGAIAAALDLVRAGEASTGLLHGAAQDARPADGSDLAPSRLTLDVRDRVMDALDPEHALELLRTVIATPSPSRDEFYLAGFLAGELEALGFDQVTVDRFAPGRGGTSGVMRGAGGGDALLLAAHLDTAGTDGWADRWSHDEREDPFAAIIADGALWGRGAAGSKGGLAAALAALWTLKRAGFRPRGDLVLACVADRRADDDGTGLSRSMRKLEAQLRNGELPRPDFALYLEPTGLAVHPTQTGYLSMRLSVRPRDGATDPRRAALAIGVALNEHARALARRTMHPLLGPASLEVGEIQDRGVYGIAMQVNRSVLPGECLDEAATAIETVVAGASGPRIETKITYLHGRDHSLGGRPFEVSPDEPGIARLRGAIRTVRPGGGQIRGARSWSELSFITGLGVPGAYFSPGLEAHRDSLEEHVSVEDHLDAVRALALFLAEHCLTTPDRS